jgi:hypothetical protein
VCVCVYFERVCCSICNFGISRKCLTQKNSLCLPNFALNWGGGGEMLQGNLFCRPENYVLTLVGMGEPVTFIKHSYIWLLLQCETPIFTFLSLLLRSPNIIWNYNEAVVLFCCWEDTCRRFSRICYFNPTETEIFIDTICSQFPQLPRVTLNYEILDYIS